MIKTIIALALAATISATPTSSIDKKVEDLKDRIATKVAELTQSQRKAVSGTVKSVSLTTVVVESSTQEYKIELTDDLTIIQYLKGKRTKLKADVLAKDNPVSIFGTYDTTLSVLKANVIHIESPQPRRIHGMVKAIDRKAAAITLALSDGSEWVIDVEKSTVTNRWTSGSETEKSGFSKISEGDILHVSGTDVLKKENRINADTILDLGNLSRTTPSPTQEASPSATPEP